MKNVINITHCDNQLTIVAVAPNNAIYQLARVGSGPAVDISVAIEEGDYIEPKSILNPTGPINDVVKLPAGTYGIYYTGINSGGPYNFKFTLNGSTFELLNGKAAATMGYIWNKGGSKPSDINIQVG